jgi:hypothetical protein
VIDHDHLRTLLGPLLGARVELEMLKEKPGRRVTMRARGSRRTAIVKLYVSERAATVAARIRGLADGPGGPLVPEVLLLDAALHLVVLSEVPGVPLTRAHRRRSAVCARGGAALGAWHAAGRGEVRARIARTPSRANSRSSRGASSVAAGAGGGSPALRCSR